MVYGSANAGNAQGAGLHVDMQKLSLEGNKDAAGADAAKKVAFLRGGRSCSLLCSSSVWFLEERLLKPLILVTVALRDAVRVCKHRQFAERGAACGQVDNAPAPGGHGSQLFLPAQWISFTSLLLP